MPVVEYAKTLDLDRIEKALATAPRTDFTPTLQTFEALRKNGSLFGLFDWVGQPKGYEPVGRKEDGRYRSTYALKDGSKVVVTTARMKIESVVHEAADGKRTELLK
jgi:hypothetical protein